MNPRPSLPLLEGRRPRRPRAAPPAIPAARRPRRGGVLGWLAAALVFCAALAALAWMLLLPAAVQSRFTASTGGAELRVRGLMGDPFSGRATVTGWTLRASAAPDARVLAHGAASEIVSSDWQSALRSAGASEPVTIGQVTLHANELFLAPDARNRWPLLALGAAVGLPYERDGKTGDGPRVRVKHLRLVVDSVVVRDAASGRDTPVRIDWRGEFRDLDHSRPVVAALLAAAAGRRAAP